MGGSESKDQQIIMKYTLVVKPSAQEDMLQAYRWYQEQRQGLGDEFLLCVEAAFSKILAFPDAYKIDYKNVHRFLTQRFPFSIFFIIEGVFIFIISVRHRRRNPDAWKSRK